MLSVPYGLGEISSILPLAYEERILFFIAEQIYYTAQSYIVEITADSWYYFLTFLYNREKRYDYRLLRY